MPEQPAAGECPDCGTPILRIRLGHHESRVTAKPDRDHGEIALVGDVGVFLRYHLLRDAKRAGLPLYRRHGVTCPHFWKGRINANR